MFDTNNKALALEYDFITTLKNLCVESACIISHFKRNSENYLIPPQTQVLLDEMKTRKSILLTAHISNQEFFGSILKKEGLDLRAYHQELNSPFWNNILKKHRFKNGDYSPYSIKNLKEAIHQFKRENYTIAFLWDQHNPSNKNKSFSLKNKSYSPNRVPYQFEAYADNIFIGTLFRQGDSYVVQLKKIDFLESYPKELEVLINTHKNQWFGVFHKIFKSSINY